MPNPFDDASGQFLVLCNDEGQYSLWPEFIAVPEGWSVALAASGRQACLDFVTANWTDMRPRSLITAMQEQGQA